MNLTITIIAVLCLGVGIGIYLWAVRKPRVRYANATNVIAWLLIALFPTLIIFRSSPIVPL